MPKPVSVFFCPYSGTAWDKNHNELDVDYIIVGKPGQPLVVLKNGEKLKAVRSQRVYPPKEVSFSGVTFTFDDEQDRPEAWKGYATDGFRVDRFCIARQQFVWPDRLKELAEAFNGREAGMQALANEAQELGMGYGVGFAPNEKRAINGLPPLP